MPAIFQFFTENFVFSTLKVWKKIDQHKALFLTIIIFLKMPSIELFDHFDVITVQLNRLSQFENTRKRLIIRFDSELFGFLFSVASNMSLEKFHSAQVLQNPSCVKNKVKTRWISKKRLAKSIENFMRYLLFLFILHFISFNVRVLTWAR